MILYCILTLLLSIPMLLGGQIVYNGKLMGRPDENYVKPVDGMTFLHFLVAVLISFVVLFLADRINILYQKNILRKEQESSGNSDAAPSEPKDSGFGLREADRDRTGAWKQELKSFFLFFLVLIIAWLPYFLSYMPGGVYSDTFSCITEAYNMDTSGFDAVNNHQPVLYAMMWRAMVLFGRNFNFSIEEVIFAFKCCQYLFMAGVLAYLLVWLRRRFHFKWESIVSTLFLAFFPLFPLYAVSLWKDTLFSLFLLLFSLAMADYVLVEDRERVLRSRKYLLKLCILAFFVSFLRNNGKYIVFICFAVILLMNLRKLRHQWRFAGMFLALVLAIQFVQGPVYDRKKFNVDSTVESVGVPMQQIAYLVYYDYDLSEDEIAYINRFCPVESIRENYNPCLFDTIKWYAPGFDIRPVDDDVPGFLRFYAKLFAKHPAGCLKGYMLATAGFWAPNIASNIAYVYPTVFDNKFGVESTDFLADRFGWSVRGLVDAMCGKPIGSAVFLLVMFFACALVILRKDYKWLLLFLPAILNWLTVMAATPIATSLRYVYILVLLLPVDVLVVLQAEQKEKSTPQSDE